MSIKISEKPVISMDTGKVLGALKGLIYENNKVTFLYCRFPNRYVYIPIKEAYIGSDAIMLKPAKDINILHTDSKPKVYTTNGKELGTITSIETNEDFNITGIFVDNLFIESDKILHMEDIVIVKTDNKKDIEDTVLSTEESSMSTESQEISDNDNEEEIDPITYELEVESNPTSTTPLTDNSGLQNEVNLLSSEDDSINEIDPRYNYLIGKKLLEDITIVDKTYKKGRPIDVSLIKLALENNGIVKVIMNTED